MGAAYGREASPPIVDITDPKTAAVIETTAGAVIPIAAVMGSSVLIITLVVAGPSTADPPRIAAPIGSPTAPAGLVPAEMPTVAVAVALATAAVTAIAVAGPVTVLVLIMAAEVGVSLVAGVVI